MLQAVCSAERLSPADQKRGEKVGQHPRDPHVSPGDAAVVLMSAKSESAMEAKMGADGSLPPCTEAGLIPAPGTCHTELATADET